MTSTSKTDETTATKPTTATETDKKATASETTTAKEPTRAEKAAAKKAEKEAAAKAKADEAAANAPVRESGRFAIEYAAAGESGKWLGYGVRSTAATAIGFVDGAKSATATRTWRVRDTKSGEILHTRVATETPAAKEKEATAA